MEFRNDVLECEQIFKKLVKDPGVRIKVAELLAGKIGYAQNLDPERWAVTIDKKKTYLRMVVGLIEVLQFRAKSVVIILDNYTFPVMLRNAPGVKIDPSVPKYSSVDGSLMMVVSYDNLFNILPDIELCHQQLMKNASETSLHYESKNAHSPGMLTFLSSFIGKAFPRPYFDTSEVAIRNPPKKSTTTDTQSRRIDNQEVPDEKSKVRRMPTPSPKGKGIRVINWNINKGGRKPSEIVKVLLGSGSDVIVLPEYRKNNPTIGNELQGKGFTPHIPTEDYESGNQVAIFTRKVLGFSVEKIKVPGLHGLVLFVQNEELMIGGVFFPKKGIGEPSVQPFLEWIKKDSFGLSKKPTILTGDFNHGVQARFWNKSQFGPEYNILRNWTGTEEKIWSDCCPVPDSTTDYQWTFCGSTNTEPDKKNGVRWPRGSSRPDHFFVSKHVAFGEVQILTGHVAKGLSDHEPMVCEFIPCSPI
jgi:exonuclease III